MYALQTHFTLHVYCTYSLKIAPQYNSNSTAHNYIEFISGSERFRSGNGKLKFRRYFTMLCNIENVVHSLEPGESPSNSASHNAPNYVQHS